MKEKTNLKCIFNYSFKKKILNKGKNKLRRLTRIKMI